MCTSRIQWNEYSRIVYGFCSPVHCPATSSRENTASNFASILLPLWSWRVYQLLTVVVLSNCVFLYYTVLELYCCHVIRSADKICSSPDEICTMLKGDVAICTNPKRQRFCWVMFIKTQLYWWGHHCYQCCCYIRWYTSVTLRRKPSTSQKSKCVRGYCI